MNAVILFGHGSRASGSSSDIERAAVALSSRLPGMTVRVAHLELCPPKLASVVGELVTAGATRIVVLPYFLHWGNHLQTDIPRQVDALRLEYPRLELILGPHIGFDERLVAILEQRLAEALRELR